MKKTVGLLLATILLFSFSGCSTENDLISDFDALIKLDESNYPKKKSHTFVWLFVLMVIAPNLTYML